MANTITQLILNTYKLSSALSLKEGAVEHLPRTSTNISADVPDTSDEDIPENPEEIEGFIKGIGEVPAEKPKEHKKDPVKAIIKRYLNQANIYDATDVIWGGFSSNAEEKTSALVRIINNALDEYIKLNPTITLNKLPDTPDFISSFTTSLAKLYIIYTSWYTTLGLTISPPNTTDSDRLHTLDYSLNVARKELTQATISNATKNNIKGLFKSLPIEIQERILKAPDKTGLLRVLSQIGLKEHNISIISNLLNTVILQEATLRDASSINKSGSTYFDTLVNISYNSTLNGIIGGLLPIIYTLPFMWEEYEVTVKNSFFNKYEESKLIDEILTKHKSSDDLTAKTEADAIRRGSEAEEIEFDKNATPDEIEIPELGSDISSHSDNSSTSITHLHGAPRGIKLFNEIDNSNFARLFDYLLTNKYVANHLDVITVPPSAINVSPVKTSLIDWLNRIDTSSVEARTESGAIYYNISLGVIDFISIFAENLTSPSGSSLPLSSDKLQSLTDAVTIFGERHQIASLQLRLTKGQVELKKENKANDFFSILNTLILGVTSLSSGQKSSLVTSIKTAQELPTTIEKYIDVIRLIYEHDPKIATTLPLNAIKKITDPTDEFVSKKVASLISKVMTLDKTIKMEALQKFGISLPTYDKVTFLFQPVEHLQNMIATLQEKSEIDPDLAYRLEKQLQYIKDIKTAYITEAIIPAMNKKTMISEFIQECLPLMDNIIMDARNLVSFIRNIVHSKKPLSYFPESDVFADNMGDFSKFRSALVNADSVPPRMVTSIINAFIYNGSGSNEISKEEAFKQQAYPQDIERLNNILDYMKIFIPRYLLSDPNISRDDIMQFITEIGKLKTQLSTGTEINLDGIKKYFILFKPQILSALFSKTGQQNATLKTIERILSQHVLGHILGISNPESVTKEMKAEAQAQETSKIPVIDTSKQQNQLSVPDTSNTQLQSLLGTRIDTGSF